MQRQEILDYLRKLKKDSTIFSSFILFGSYAREDNRKDSDIDIIYSLKDGTKLSFDKYMEIEEELKKAFNTKIDLINVKRLNPLVRMNAQKDFIYV
jgi:predicted nucleotidyltransferase